MRLKLGREGRQHSLLAVRLVLGCDLVVEVGVVVLDEVAIQQLGHVGVHDDLLSVRGDQDLVQEIGVVRLAGARGERVEHLALEPLGEILVALAGDDGEHVDLVDHFRRVHPVALLIHAQPHAAAHLLPLHDGAVAVLERADGEDVRVVPAFAQRGVREDEADRLVEGEQALLVLEDQVVGVHVVRLVGSLPQARIDEAVRLLVDGEIAVVGLLHGDRLDVVDEIHGRRVDEKIQVVDCILILLAKHLGILPRQLALLVVLAVLGHLVDEEEGEDFDSLGMQLVLLAQVRMDRLPDLDAAHRRLRDVAHGVAGLQLAPVGEGHALGGGVDVADDAVPVLVEPVRERVDVGARVQAVHFANNGSRLLLNLEIKPSQRGFVF